MSETVKRTHLLNQFVEIMEDKGVNSKEADDFLKKYRDDEEFLELALYAKLLLHQNKQAKSKTIFFIIFIFALALIVAGLIYVSQF